MKLAGKNELEKRLPDFRVRISKLPELARYQSFGRVYAEILYLRDKFDDLAEELYMIENQEEIWGDDTDSKNDITL